MKKKKDISIEEKLHIPLVAQFETKNAAIAVQLGRIFVQFREISRPRRGCRRIRRRRRRWRGLAAPLSHWKDEGKAEAFCFMHTIKNCMRNQQELAGFGDISVRRIQEVLLKVLTFGKIDFFIFTA
jgi:hypothetical protein